MVTVTVGSSPTATPALPLSIGSAFFVGVATAFIDTNGLVVSTLNVTAALVPTLPASSRWTACAVYVPSSRCGDVYDHVPPATGTLPDATSFPVTELPSWIVTVMLGSSPASTPAPPVSVGSASFVGEATALIDTAGGVVSTVNVTELLVPGSASLVCSATAVYWPGASDVSSAISHAASPGAIS